MLGKFVKVRVTKPQGCFDRETNTKYLLNYGVVESGLLPRSPVAGAYILGVDHPVRRFDGRVVQPAVAFLHKGKGVSIDCFYERSCGAVVFRDIGGEKRFLLIKNKRSAHWGFPKGHVEKGETDEQTACREVLEETGIHISIFPDFKSKSEYTIQGKINKTVLIFLATTKDTQTVIQQSEIEDYIWLGFDAALDTLNYENDKAILKKAKAYMDAHQLF